MPIKHDETGRRWVEMEILVPGTPEQVWQAMATGPGNAGWFIKAEIEERVGGTLRFDFGGGVSTKGEVTEWEPPLRFGYVEREWEPGAPPVATEITLTARSGDRCVVRMVHSLFTSSDAWDDQVEGFEKGWVGFFAILRVYLERFSGESAAGFMAMVPTTGDALSAWLRLCETLGMAHANVGERRSASFGPEEWSGTVEHVHQDKEQRYVLLRLDAPSPGIALFGTNDSSASGLDRGAVEKEVGKGPAVSVSLCRYFYGDDAETLATQSEERWRSFLAEKFGDAAG
jgi:uncharacterized protein YndB with AHSA1/START domain